MPTPIELDRKSQAEGLTLKDVKSAIPASCYEINRIKAWWGMLRGLSMPILLAYMISWVPLSGDLHLLWQIPLLLGLWLCQGSADVGLIILAHDCGHGAFSKRRWLNDLMGHFCTSFMMVGYHNWQISHNHHHAYSQMLHQDTDWPEKMFTADEYPKLPLFWKLYVRLGYGSPVGLIVGFLTGNLRRTFMPIGYPQIFLSKRFRRQLLLSTLVMFVCTGSLQVALVMYTGWWGLLKYYWMGALFGFVLGSLITQVQHTNADTLVFEKEHWSPLRAHVITTFNVRFPRIIEFLAFDFNFHVAHHISPRVPWYNLRKATAGIRQAYPEYLQERDLRLRDLLDFWRQPLLDWNAEPGYYTMRGFPNPAQVKIAAQDA